MYAALRPYCRSVSGPRGAGVPVPVPVPVPVGARTLKTTHTFTVGAHVGASRPTAQTPHFCQAPQRTDRPRETCRSSCAAGTVPTAPDSTRRPDLDLPAFRRFSMITVRAGQAASHGSCTSCQPCCSGRSDRRRQAVSIQISRDSGGENRRISQRASPCAHGVRGRPQMVESWQWRRAPSWIRFSLHHSSRRLCMPLLPRLLHQPP